MPSKNPLYTQVINLDESYTADPAKAGGITYNSSSTAFRMNVGGTVYSIPTSATAGASKALDDLAAVAINTSLVSDTDSTDDLGSSSKYWANTYSDVVLLNSTASFSGALAGTAALSGALSVSLGSTLTGNVACGGNLSVDGSFSVASFSSDAIAAATAATDLTLDGLTSGGVDICSTSTGGITLGDDTTLATGKNMVLTSGNLTLTAGAATVTDGNLVLSEGVFTVDTTSDEGAYIKRNQAATTSVLLELEETNAAADNVALLIDHNATGACSAMEIDHEGTADCLSIASKAAAASVIKLTAEAATGTALEAICAASTTGPQVLIDGTTGNWIGADGVGQLEITCDGALAHANASCLLIEYSGTGAATGLGTSLRIVDTGATATSTAVYISAATGEALRIDAGTVIFDESLAIGTSATVGTTLDVTGATTLTAGIAGKMIHSGTGITVSAGPAAVAVTGAVHEITTTGAGDAMTLANGTAGQKLSVIYVAEGGGADTAVITPTTLAGGATITLSVLGDSCDLVYSATGGWYVLGLGGSAAVA